MEHSDLRYLLVDLPEDIRRMKDLGDFSRMERVINMRLKSDLPVPMRKRLELELKMDALLPQAYPFSREEAEKRLADAIKDFSPNELDYWRDIDAADWIYINGQERYRRNFIKNLIGTRKDIEDRAIDKSHSRYAKANAELLDRVIMKMREKGEAAYRFRVKASVAVYDSSKRVGKKIRVHIPVPIEGAQMEDVKIIRCSDDTAVIGEKDYPQRTVYFEKIYEDGDEFSVEYEYVNRMRYVKPDSTKVLSSQPTFYLGEQAPHIVFKPYIVELTKDVVKGETNPLIKAKLIYDFLTSKPVYSYMPPYFTVADLPGFMATRMKGDCGVFSLMFITMCRIAGVPARWQSGLYTTPIEIGMHDWSQFYIAPYGWLYADCSFGNSAHRGNAEHRRDFYFGNLDPFRMVAASEFQHDFYPPMKYMRYDPYDNQDGEAEYEDAPLSNSEIKTNQEMLSWEEL